MRRTGGEYCRHEQAFERFRKYRDPAIRAALDLKDFRNFVQPPVSGINITKGVGIGTGIQSLPAREYSDRFACSLRDIVIFNVGRKKAV